MMALIIFSDEIYEYFTYDGLKHISPGSLSEIQDRIITISGYSKTFNITGWRIGYCVCDEKWSTMIGYINDLVYVLVEVRDIPGETSKEKAMFILHRTGVAGVPGSAFYHDDGGENMVRFCYAKKEDVLNDACERLLRI